MPSNHTGTRIGYLAGLFPGRIGHLFSPGGERGPFGFIPHALDNGVFAGWDETRWLSLIAWAKANKIAPMWALVPDAVGDRELTLDRWCIYAQTVRETGWPLAFAVQDGMTKEDVPADTDVVFVGGSTEWKWRTVAYWCENFERVHVGRVNTGRRLWEVHGLGAESCDGTGWMRGDPKQFGDLFDYLAKTTPGFDTKIRAPHLSGADL